MVLSFVRVLLVGVVALTGFQGRAIANEQMSGAEFQACIEDWECRFELSVKFAGYTCLMEIANAIKMPTIVEYFTERRQKFSKHSRGLHLPDRDAVEKIGKIEGINLLLDHPDDLNKMLASEDPLQQMYAFCVNGIIDNKYMKDLFDYD